MRPNLTEDSLLRRLPDVFESFLAVMWRRGSDFYDDMNAFEARLGHRFANLSLAVEALTHRSASAEWNMRTRHPESAAGESANPDIIRPLPSNERLEFLGDAVLGVVVSDTLVRRSSADLSEGDMSRVRAQIVREETLAMIAEHLDLAPLVLSGRSEDESWSTPPAAVMADALEAIIGAVYLDAGLDAAHTVVARHFSAYFDGDWQSYMERDFKTTLQELLQGQYRVTPAYNVISEQGPEHRKTFEVTVSAEGRQLGVGLGLSKKKASQAAAEHALQSMRADRDNRNADAPSPARERDTQEL